MNIEATSKAIDESTVDRLISLIHVDMDAVLAYEQALKNIDDERIKENLISFVGEHQTHITALSACVRNMGREPPKAGADIKGFFLKGFTAVLSVVGTKGALTAMLQNERITNKMYEEASVWELKSEYKDLIAKNCADEKKHLGYIENQLAKMS